jgi:curved DNA-binding protein
MEFKDYYASLGVEKTASEDDIRKAYRRLARKYHPDVSKEADAEERMRDINEAYEALRDKERRQAYDEVAANAARGGGFQPPPGWERGFEFRGAGGESAEFSEFFSSIFGNNPRGGGFRGRPDGRAAFRQRGEDHHAVIEIDLEDALQGASRDINLKTLGAGPTKTRTLNVRIPVGVREGQRIRLTGQGVPGTGGAPNGDLYLEVRIAPHKIYRVEGRDLYVTLPITPWEAALGASVKAPSPGGTVQVTIPPGSGSGRKMRLRGRGVPGTPDGDLYLLLDVVVPPATTEAAREAYENLAKIVPFDPRKSLGL